MSANLIVHAGGRTITREELALCPTPAPTSTWRPVPHFDMVSAMVEGLAAAGILIRREQYCVSCRADARLFGTLDLAIPDLDRADYKMAIGLRGSNDKSMALQVIAAARVTVCDNMLFGGSGGTVVLRRRHTSRLVLADLIPPAIDGYLAKAGGLALSIERMQEMQLTDQRAKAIIYDAFAGKRGPVLPQHLFREIGRLYFDDTEQRDKFAARNMWALNNAFTESVKGLKPMPQARGGVAIGRYFGRIMAADRQASRAEPARLHTGPDGNPEIIIG